MLIVIIVLPPNRNATPLYSRKNRALRQPWIMPMSAAQSYTPSEKPPANGVWQSLLIAARCRTTCAGVSGRKVREQIRHLRQYHPNLGAHKVRVLLGILV